MELKHYESKVIRARKQIIAREKKKFVKNTVLQLSTFGLVGSALFSFLILGSVYSITGSNVPFSMSEILLAFGCVFAVTSLFLVIDAKKDMRSTIRYELRRLQR